MNRIAQAALQLARRLAVVLSAGVASTFTTCALAEDVGFFPQTTYKIVQLTGETDHPRRIPTLSRTGSRYCVYGTDLGSTFEHNGQLYFLFGDTPSLGSGPPDFLAWTTSTRPEDVVLDVRRDGSCARSITIPGVRLSGCEIPSYGISVSGYIYLVATTDTPDGTCSMGRSVMAVSSDHGLNFQKLYDLSNVSQGGKFINVSMVEVYGGDYPTLPPEPCVLIWGSGSYRHSDVFLAYVPSAQIGNKSAIRYLSDGVQSGTPSWSVFETDAVPLFSQSQPQVGELSVQYCPQLGKWIMLYNSGDDGDFKSGIHMRSAILPWGPWSVQPTVIFDASRDNAYGRYMHRPGWDVFHDSPLIGPEDDKIGAYGPYLIPRFFRGDQNRVTIVYSMSTWNPYQTLLMQSDIGYPNRLPPEVITTSVTLPGDTGAGWVVSGNFLRTFTRHNVPYVSSYGNNGDADMGVAQYGFVPGCSDQALEFNVHGGDGEVVLIEQTGGVPTAPANLPQFYDALKAGSYGPVVECMVGPQNNFDNAPDHKVRWDLRRHRGKTMRLFLIDSLTVPWGFINVSQVTRFFVNKNEPVNIYVNGENTSGPFLGTPDFPFPTVTAGYNAVHGSVCPANVLMIRAGLYPETLTMNKPVTLKTEGGAATIRP